MPDRDRDPIDVAMERIEMATFIRGEDAFRAEVRLALRTLVAAVGKTPAEERVLAAMVEADRATEAWDTARERIHLQPEAERLLDAEAEEDAARSALRAEREGGGGE